MTRILSILCAAIGIGTAFTSLYLHHYLMEGTVTPMSVADGFSPQNATNTSVIVPYLAPFYLFTFFSVSLFVWKMIKPKSISLPVYASAMFGVISAFVLNSKMELLRSSDMSGGDPNSPWIILMPNLVIILLMAGIDGYFLFFRSSSN